MTTALQPVPAPEPPATVEDLIAEQLELKLRKAAVLSGIQEINHRLKNGDGTSLLYPRREKLIAEQLEIETDLAEIKTELDTTQRRAEFREIRVNALRQLTCALIAGGYDAHDEGMIQLAARLERDIQATVP
jgi:hypothetical protein